MNKINKNWQGIWGYSMIVGEWHFQLPAGDSDDLKNRFERLVHILNEIVNILKQLHTLHKISIDISLLGEKIQEDGVIMEENFLEFVSVDCNHLKDLVPSIKATVQEYSRFIITSIFIDLNTLVKENNQEIIVPESASLYITGDNEAIVKEKTELYVSYTTNINVWLKKVYDNQFKILLDNEDVSKLNLPRLNIFLKSFENKFGVSIKAGESRWYEEFLENTGFVFDKD